MKIFLRENWFKLIISIAFLTLAVSVGYYFLLSKPNFEKLQSEAKQRQIESKKECFNEATEYKNSIIKTESDFINSGGKITRANYDKILDDTYRECLLRNGLEY